MAGRRRPQSGTGFSLFRRVERLKRRVSDLKGAVKGMVKGESKRCEARARGAGSTRTATQRTLRTLGGKSSSINKNITTRPHHRTP